jgi:hypothetical protein
MHAVILCQPRAASATGPFLQLPRYAAASTGHRVVAHPSQVDVQPGVLVVHHNKVCQASSTLSIARVYTRRFLCALAE